MSSINPNNIDGTYPIAGQDNDSQGFRDNFTNIKNNFTFAYDELTDLQSKAVLKSALNGSTLDNTMTYTSLNTSGNLLATGLSVFGNASISILNVSTLNISSTSTFSGNLVTVGAKAEQGVQVYRPTANVAVTANVTVSRVLLAPTGTVISFGANVTLPNTTVNGTTVDISSNVATTLAIQAPWLSSISPFGNVQLTAGNSARYFYDSTDNRWFKV